MGPDMFSCHMSLHSSRCLSRSQPVCHCNGTRLAAVRWVYTIAGAEARAPTGDIFVNCGRPLWSGAKGKIISAAVVACKAAVNASRQARLKEVAAWHNSAYMRSAAYSGDCHKRFSCSPTSIKSDGRQYFRGKERCRGETKCGPRRKLPCVRCVRSHSSFHMVPAWNDAQDLFSLGEVDHLLDAHQVVRTWIFVRVWAWAREGQG